jgi:hypothetical protein
MLSRLEVGEIGHRASVEALGLACAVEEEVCDADDDVVDDLRCCNDIGEPYKLDVSTCLI